MFGIAQSDVLECLSCPLAEEVLVGDRALENPGTTYNDVGAVAERLLVE